MGRKDRRRHRVSPWDLSRDDRNQPGKGRVTNAVSFEGEMRRESGEFWGCRTVGEGILG